ncbi:elongation factor P--(R)-beta-lysine ligase [Paraglaciecola sp.]|uniref:elongation factor P--(R)-beta-lysine ligase n=1 Tax=Paraglaciecola sp. TaxID=1920173 RepID=UPI0030F483A6
MSSNSDWRPSASLQVLQQRAKIIRQIRQFFYARDVLEVDTPALSHASVTDLNLRAFSTQFNDPSSPHVATLFLQTSPEFAMKRLLCAGSGAIFQLSKAFRNEEAGRWHNPEFTMLEWYRPDFDHFMLMNEIDALVGPILGTDEARRLTYQQAFMHVLACDPIAADLAALQKLSTDLGYGDLANKEADKDVLLNLLFSQHVEPAISQDKPCFVYDFPASQAALARLNPDDPRVAQRFELYFRGVELANGFHELSDPQEQRQRFLQDNLKRQQQSLPIIAYDELFLAALESGLPSCAGVALGIDRLIMLALGCERLSQVLAFSYSKA